MPSFDHILFVVIFLTQNNKSILKLKLRGDIFYRTPRIFCYIGIFSKITESFAALADTLNIILNVKQTHAFYAVTAKSLFLVP